ncbi:hypothetical protein KP509_13G075500 [Ceratopteris richardii]|uniref:Uncharacterized protein n=1 Tax=Ceratopteris richardii TaxID=49495 RepID=A0A8T2TJ66_CERRI|nr:hypothetical protein KP509_13G075500 [Ceratopteris richardii]
MASMYDNVIVSIMTILIALSVIHGSFGEAQSRQLMVLPEIEFLARQHRSRRELLEVGRLLERVFVDYTPAGANTSHDPKHRPHMTPPQPDGSANFSVPSSTVPQSSGPAPSVR